MPTGSGSLSTGRTAPTAQMEILAFTLLPSTLLEVKGDFIITNIKALHTRQLHL